MPLPKGCPILRLAYLLRTFSNEEHGIDYWGSISIHETHCMETYCGIYDQNKKQCGLISKEASNNEQ